MNLVYVLVSINGYNIPVEFIDLFGGMHNVVDLIVDDIGLSAVDKRVVTNRYIAKTVIVVCFEWHRVTRGIGDGNIFRRCGCSLVTQRQRANDSAILIYLRKLRYQFFADLRMGATLSIKSQIVTYIPTCITKVVKVLVGMGGTAEYQQAQRHGTHHNGPHPDSSLYLAHCARILCVTYDALHIS